MADGHHLKKIAKWPYLRNSFTDQHEIWHGDAYWACEKDQNLQFPTFKNPRWRAHLSTEGSFNIHERQLTEINVIASFCA